MAEFEIHITDFKISADEGGRVSFWCKNNSSKTVPKAAGSYHILIRDTVGHNLAENAVGQPSDFKPGDVVTIDNMYVGDWRYPIGSGIFVVSVLWRWEEEGEIVALVYDTKRYTIELEGEAEIVEVSAPSSFTPDVPFPIAVTLKNVGAVSAVLFARIINSATGEVLGKRDVGVAAGTTAYPITIMVELTQTTDFHGRVEAGHIE